MSSLIDILDPASKRQKEERELAFKMAIKTIAESLELTGHELHDALLSAVEKKRLKHTQEEITAMSEKGIRK